MTCDVLIIGGGVAGSALARSLALQGFDVAVAEARRLPAHKLCGEFWSPEVQHALSNLGMLAAVRSAGAVEINRAVLTAAAGARFEQTLPAAALGISRRVMDPLMLDGAEEAGASVLRQTRVTSVEGSARGGFAVRAGRRAVRARLVIGAYGRRDRLDRVLRQADLQEASPWVAFKAHFRGVRVPDLIELHTFEGGYCGLSEVEDGAVNVCWIAHRDRLKADGGTPEGMLRGSLARNPALRDRLGVMEPVSEFKSASQLRFAARDTWASGVPLVGDAAGMIAPLCGDGMAMALDGAALLAGHAAAFLRGDRTVEAFESGYREDWNRQFRKRLTLGRFLHRALTHDRLADAALRLAGGVPPVGAWAIRATRGL